MTTTRDGRSEIRWTPRVSKHQVRRLYEADAQGIVDQDLLDEVGTMLFARCRDILTIKAARMGHVKCPRCARKRRETVIERAHPGGDARDELLVCPQCGWQITWGEYRLSFKHKQLHSGGATEWFEDYVQAYPRARTAREKMLAIDRLIHAFHYSLRRQPDLPTRPACVNLIAGKVTDVVQFLDELTYGESAPAELRKNREVWRREVQRTVWRYTIEED
ncbi:MAG: hypothetical protein JXA89_22645 [Anaerolineae bacterium]|nr:hypothetical protein [Anaerolineae bacterium]